MDKKSEVNSVPVNLRTQLDQIKNNEIVIEMKQKGSLTDRISSVFSSHNKPIDKNLNQTEGEDKLKYRS